MSAVLFAAIVFLAFVVEATAGFGATVVTVTLAAHAFPIHDVLAAFVPVNLLLSVYLVVRYRALADGRFLARRILPAMGAGMLAGMALDPLLHQQLWIKALFGAFVVSLALGELLGARRGAAGPARPLPAPLAGVALVGAGLIHGVFACGGPLVVWVVGREIDDKGRFRATLSALWLTLHTVLLINYARAGYLSARSAETSAALGVSLLLGLAVGEQIHARLPGVRFRAGVYALLGVSGAALLVRTLLAL